MTFESEEGLHKGRGVRVEVLYESRCIIHMMKSVQEEPELRYGDIGRVMPQVREV